MLDSIKFVALYITVVLGLNENPKVLLISLDGFRYDLLNETMVPNMHKLALSSSWFVNGSRSQYITFTDPNHMSIVTGLYEENHGIVSNFFYDPVSGKKFDYFNSTQLPNVVNSSRDEHWYKGEPVWLTNENGGPTRKSATIDWPNGEVNFPFPPHKPNYSRAWETFGDLTSWKKDVDTIIDMFTREKDPMNFIAWYVAEPDHTLHGNGFYNGELKKMLLELDNLVAYLVEKMEERDLFRHINMILTADHGHAEITDEKHVMCIPDYISIDGLNIGDHMIYTRNEEHKKEIYKNLTEAIAKHGYKVKVYDKKEFPAEFHYSNSARVGDIIIEAEIGSATSFNCHKTDLERTYGSGKVKYNSSTHGHDPNSPEMRAILLMKGPAFRSSEKITMIPDNIDLFPLICHLLNVTAPSHNGSLTVVSRALRNVQQLYDGRMKYNVVTDSLSFLVFFIPPFIIVLLYIAYGCRHTILRSDPNWARTSSGYRVLQSDNVHMDSNDVENIPMGRDAVAMSQLLKDLDSEDEF